MTMIGRVADGLPLAASVHNDMRDESGRSSTEYQNQAKNILRRLTPTSPSKASIETDPYIFHCLIDHDVCYITLCEKTFPRKNAYAYLEDLAQEFIAQYGQKIQLAARPYSFIEFDNYIQKMKKQYTDSRTSREAMGRLRTDLRDVQNIMFTNIQDVMSRGESLQDLSSKATNLASISQKYRQDANYLNRMSSLTKIGLTVGSIVILALIAYVFIF
jgi:vesicle transport protein SEC22